MTMIICRLYNKRRPYDFFDKGANSNSKKGGGGRRRFKDVIVSQETRCNLKKSAGETDSPGLDENTGWRNRRPITCYHDASRIFPTQSSRERRRKERFTLWLTTDADRSRRRRTNWTRETLYIYLSHTNILTWILPGVLSTPTLTVAPITDSNPCTDIQTDPMD